MSGDEITERLTKLEHALSALVAQVKRVGGYMTPEEQAVLWQAEQLVAKHGGGR